MASLDSKAISNLARQVRLHLESLKAAGMEWLPSAKGAAEILLLEPAADSPMAETSLLPDPKPIASTVAIPAQSGGSSASSVEGCRQALTFLVNRVSKCSRCPELFATRTQTVFGVGKARTDLCFVGEAPGADEDRQGEPFVGAAGKLLNRIIVACGMTREEVYICNIIKCRPPGNRTPLPNEAANCRAHFERQLELVQPKFICALGSTAARYLLNTTQGIGQLRGRFHDYRGIPVICTYHPAYLLPHRSPGKKKEVWEDMKMLLAKMGRPIK